MLPSFGLGYYLLGLPLFFRNLRLEDHSAERVRRAAERGPVVYVLHTRSQVDWLALNRVLVESKLPLPVFANGMDATFWMPLAEQGRALSRRFRGETPAFDPVTNGWLADCIASGRPTCLFLAPRRDIRDLVVRRDEPDPVQALLDAQARTDRPVQVLPVVVISNRSPEPARTEVGRFLIGLEDIPASLGKLVAIGTRQGDALVQVGDPISLAEYVERYKAEPAPRLRKMLRLALRRWLYREARVVRGPRSRPRGWVRRQVLESRVIAELVERETAATGRPPEKVRAEVAKTYDQIAARFSFPVVRIFGWLCRQIWNRIYSGIDVRPADLDRIRGALRTGTPILVPCHRSHLDYLLISSLLLEHDVVIPHIVAGDNLSFWPLGAIFRRAGAFFIRRSFAGERVFPVVFGRYLQELVRMEVPVEFFIEGGRSRTGKLQPPKLGVFGMLMDAAAAARADREVSFLPIYIGYEQIAEERAYARELSGQRKEKESVQQVVKATGVLKNRYGKVYLRVGEPLLAREITAGEDWPSLSKARRHELLQSAGERLLHRINTEALALPTAIVAVAILSHARRGLRHAELRARVERLRTFLTAAQVPEGGGLEHLDGIIEEALGRFVGGRMLTALEEEHGRVYSIVAERRVTLEYYKNTVLHAFAPAAFYATAVRALGTERVDRAEVSRLFRLQQFLLRYEFVLDPDADAGTLEARAVHALVAYGALATDGDLAADSTVVTVVDRARVGEIANLVANFLESYLLVLRAARNLGVPRSQKDLPREALAFGKTLLAVDEITRPESLNLSNLENATRAFAEDGVLRRVADGRLELLPDLADPYTLSLGLLLGVQETVAP
jgi:glycerol-3-phosphate O-acyltransferase